MWLKHNSANFIGNIMEWYDFSLYGYFASIIAQQFFPPEQKILSLIFTFIIFAMGCWARPLGALGWGYFGDRFGRKRVLATTITLMACTTTIMGLLPTYHQIGIIAPFLLLMCRLLQGIAVGGEYTGSIVYLTEHHQNHTFKKGFLGSLALSSSYVGLLLGSLSSGKFIFIQLAHPFFIRQYIRNNRMDFTKKFARNPGFFRNFPKHFRH